MSAYIPYTDEQKRRANAVDLEEFLRRRGERLLPSGRDKRLASDRSVTIRGCEWYDHETRQGGHAKSTSARLTVDRERLRSRAIRPMAYQLSPSQLARSWR